MMNTSSEASSAIAAVISERRQAAARSEYDWKVCVQAVGAAADLIQQIPVRGTPNEYFDAVLSGLSRLMDGYYDADGEYTSGKSDIGTIIAHIERLSKRLSSAT